MKAGGCDKRHGAQVYGQFCMYICWRRRRCGLGWSEEGVRFGLWSPRERGGMRYRTSPPEPVEGYKSNGTYCISLGGWLGCDGE